MFFYMERKLREINGSYVLTIPKQICDLYNMKQGDNISIEPIGIGELKLKKNLVIVEIEIRCNKLLI